jgi:hypothetical protein
LACRATAFTPNARYYRRYGPASVQVLWADGWLFFASSECYDLLEARRKIAREVTRFAADSSSAWTCLRSSIACFVNGSCAIAFRLFLGH